MAAAGADQGGEVPAEPQVVSGLHVSGGQDHVCVNRWGAGRSEAAWVFRGRSEQQSRLSANPGRGRGGGVSRDEGRPLGEWRHPLSQAGVCNVPCSSFCQSPQPGLRLSLCPASAALPCLLGFKIQAHHHPFCLSSPPQLPSRFWREEITHLVPLFPLAPREKPRLPAAQDVLPSLASSSPLCLHPARRRCSPQVWPDD